MENSLQKIVICSCEPAGIGPDIIIAAAQQDFNAEIVVVGDSGLLQQRAGQLGTTLEVVEDHSTVSANPHTPGQLRMIPVALPDAVTPGMLNPGNSRYVTQCIDTAVDLCLSGEFQAMVTAPAHKGIINEEGI